MRMKAKDNHLLPQWRNAALMDAGERLLHSGRHHHEAFDSVLQLQQGRPEAQTQKSTPCDLEFKWMTAKLHV